MPRNIRYLAVSAALALSMLFMACRSARAADELALPNLGSAYCAAGLGLGATLNTSRVESGAFRIDANGSGGIIAPDVTCLTRSGPWSYGLTARYTAQNVTAAVASFDLKSHSAYSAAARIGYDINAGAHLYGLAGFQQSKFTVPALSLGSDSRGLLLGAGLELDLFKGPWIAFIEVDRVAYDTKDVSGAAFKPVDVTGIAGVRYRFNFPQ